MVQTYEDYLGEIEFTVIEEVDFITEDMLYDLKNKQGYVIDKEYEVYLCKKFEPMEFLNQVIIMEKANEFYVINMVGVIMFEGSAEEVLEFTQGFFGNDTLI